MEAWLWDYLTPADCEEVVRVYHCVTVFSRLFKDYGEGYLTVTNKRLIFHVFSASKNAPSIIQNEVPIEDVSGVQFYKGKYLNWVQFWIGFFSGLLWSAIICGILTFLLIILFETEDPPLIIFGIFGVAGLLLSDRFPYQTNYPSISAFSSVYFFFMATGIMFGADSPAAIVIGSFLALAAFGYTFYCLRFYALQATMSLIIGTKAGSGEFINIVDVYGTGKINRKLVAAPANDADALIKQLGALILDIQTMGDFGIKKWKEKVNIPVN